MLVIRDRQMAAFQAQKDEAFVTWAQEQLGGEAAVPRARVQAGLRRGRRRGLSSPRALFAFIRTMVTQAPDFDRHPRVRGVLDDPAIGPDEKMSVVLETLGEDDWRAIREGSDPLAWSAED